MALFDVFTGDAYNKAADQQRQLLAMQYANINANIGTARDTGLAALQSGQTGALGAIGGGINQARSDITGYLDPATAALYAGQGAGAGALMGGQAGGLAALQSGVGTAIGAYDPLKALSAQYGAYGDQASQAQADALGLNGPEGVARAQASFRASPGYQYQLEQGVNTIARGRNITGEAAGGNTDVALQKFGQGLADQDWQAYLANLNQRMGLYTPEQLAAASAAAGGVGNAALTGGTGAANIYTGTGGRLSDLYSGTGTNLANLYTGTGRSLADLASSGGLASSNVYTGTGTNIANLLSGLSGQQTTADLGLTGQYGQTYGAQAAADTAASNNLWNLLGGGLQFAAGGGYIPGGGFTPFGSMAPKKAA